jgi:diamine N-acetyltransferase
MSITYRGAVAGDINTLAKLGRDSFIAAFEHLYSAENLNLFLNDVYSVDAIADDMANPDRLYQVAETDGRMVGYCKLGLTTGFGDDLDDSHVGRRAMDLKQLYLAGGNTGSGIGGALMQWALSQGRARGYDDVLLSVWSENYGAQRFYQRYGFTKIADIFFMVGNHRDDEFLYRLALT